MATYEKSFLLSLYRDMVRIRAFEEHAAECFTKGMLAGNIHLSIGQEAAEAGAFAAIEPRDYFTSTHRGHGHAIARGADPKRAMAELFGKAAGYCKGKGGSAWCIQFQLVVLLHDLHIKTSACQNFGSVLKKLQKGIDTKGHIGRFQNCNFLCTFFHSCKLLLT